MILWKINTLLSKAELLRDKQTNFHMVMHILIIHNNHQQHRTNIKFKPEIECKYNLCTAEVPRIKNLVYFSFSLIMPNINRLV